MNNEKGMIIPGIVTEASKLSRDAQNIVLGFTMALVSMKKGD